jgi:hypothetical protein
MQHDAQAWNDLLWCSGGKLELAKCSFHTLIFNAHPDGSVSPILPAYPDPIELRDSQTGEVIPVPSKRADNSHHTLGHWKAPADARQLKQLAEMTTKAQSIATLIHLANLTRYGATHAYHGIYVTSLKYVLPRTMLLLTLVTPQNASSHPRHSAKQSARQLLLLLLNAATTATPRPRFVTLLYITPDAVSYDGKPCKTKVRSPFF